MKNETILKKAIAKAVKNGWRGDLDLELIKNDYSVTWELYSPGGWKLNDGSILGERFYFSPDFAKAFFGEEPLEGWEYYQHQMLDEIQEGRDPIKYLQKFL